MGEIRLTAEQAVAMAREAASRAALAAEGIADAYDDPNTVRRLHAEMSPFIDLIDELQRQLTVTRVDMLRDVAEQMHKEALGLAAFEQRGLMKVRGGDPRYRCDWQTREEAERECGWEIDRALDMVAMARQVLDVLDSKDLESTVP